MLAPWSKHLGDDRVPYTNHVTRVLLICDELHALSGAGGPSPTQSMEYLACGVFHDLGIWSEGTFDYLAPSIDLARDWLQSQGREDLYEIVTAMIDNHHKIRAAGELPDPVEIFRRADTIDVVFAARRFGMPYAKYRAIRRRYPDRGFHKRLVQLTVKRTIQHPSSPLPMYRW